jgi:2,3-bisphosphoglycerate-dependent phosphoglycerate mutase
MSGLCGRVVFCRHGESIWNKAPVRFTGWANVPLTENGRLQARETGNTLKMFSLTPDVAFTSLLRRSRESLDEIQKADVNYKSITVINSWRLNERHYGALVGLSKEDATASMGQEELVKGLL